MEISERITERCTAGAGRAAGQHVDAPTTAAPSPHDRSPEASSSVSAHEATGPQAVQSPGEGTTRHEVARLLLEQGPVTAAAVSEELGISPTAVRRHLDALLADGEAEAREAPARLRRGRGRPAKLFLLTDAGRARFGHAYDDLAASAIRFLAEHGGEAALRRFAEHRVAKLVGPYREAVRREPTVQGRTEVLATALRREGYAASTAEAGAGEQLCQHHCPVAHVATEFPQLCEVETEAFAELLGTHVQRLATIARGDAACTTHVPGSATGGIRHVQPSTRTGWSHSTERGRHPIR